MFEIALARSCLKEQYEKTASGLEWAVLKPGKGALKPKIGDLCAIRFQGS
jgi:hypothetical protein